MAIVLKYGSPGPVLAAGYAAGAGSRMNKQKDDALRVWQQNSQREFQAQQSWLDRYQQNNLQQNAFAQQNQLAKDQRTFQAERQQEEMGFRSTQAGRARQYQEDQANSRNAASIAAKQRQEQVASAKANEIAVRKGEAMLPGPAKAILDKLEAGAIEAMKLDAAGQDEFFNKKGGYHDQKRDLYGMATPVPGKSRAEQLQEFRDTLPESERGKPWVLNSKGEGSLPPGWKPDTSAADEQKKIAEAQKQRAAELGAYYKDELKMMNDENKPIHSTPDAAMAAATAKYEAFQRGLGQSTQSSAQQTAQTAPVAPPAAQAAAPQVAAPQQFAAGVAPAAPVAQPPRQPAAAPPAAPAAGSTPAVPTDPRTGRALGPVRFDIDNLPSNMTQIPQNQRQLYADNMPQHVNELPEALRQKYKTSWPRPATPEDAKKLDPGTMFITPEGRIKSVPF